SRSVPSQRGSSAGSAPSLPLGDHTLGDGERRVRGGDSTIDRRLQEHLLDLVGRQPVAERGAHVHRQLVQVPAGDQGGQRDAAAGPAVQAGAVPDLVPRVAGDQVLEVGGEAVLAGLGAVDVRVPEDLSARLHPPRVPVRVGEIPLAHPSPFHVASRCAVIASVTGSGRSTLARCAASSTTVRRAPGMPAASRSAWPRGGVGPSRSPAITRVGAEISPSRPVTSNSASASQHAAYPSGSVARSIATYGSAPVNAGVNQRPAAPSATGPTPSGRTGAARSRQGPGSPNRGDVQHSTRLATRSGARSASMVPTAPPSDTPA